MNMMMASIIATIFFLIGGFQLNEKGIPLNNAYFYASKKECETMDKKPYFRQSGIAFTLIGIVFMLHSIELLLNTGWLMIAANVMLGIVIVYAIVSSVSLWKKRNL